MSGWRNCNPVEDIWQKFTKGSKMGLLMEDLYKCSSAIGLRTRLCWQLISTLS